jgi:hypothetical protein
VPPSSPSAPRFLADRDRVRLACRGRPRGLRATLALGRWHPGHRNLSARLHRPACGVGSSPANPSLNLSRRAGAGREIARLDRAWRRALHLPRALPGPGRRSPAATPTELGRPAEGSVEIDVLIWPSGKQQRKLIALLTGGTVMRSIFEQRGLPNAAPARAPARSPPELVA